MNNFSFSFGTIFGCAFMSAFAASENLSTAYGWPWWGYALLAASAMLADVMATYRASKKKVR